MVRQIGMNRIGTFNYENLLAGEFQRVTEGVDLQAGQVYPVGSVLGKNKATGRCTLVDSSKDDGTEEIYGILINEVDATSGDFPGVAFLTGEFNQNRLVFGGSDTHETHKDAARAKSIFFKDAVIRTEQ